MSYSGRGLHGWPLAVVLIATAYAAGVGAVLFRPDASRIATWWPAAGIAVVLVALAPKKQRWLLGVAVLIVTAAANVTAGQALGLSIWFGAANAVEAVVAAAILVRRTGRMPRLDS